MTFLTVLQAASAAPVRYALEVPPVTPGCQSWAILHGINASGHLQGLMSCDDFNTWRGVIWEDEGFVEIDTFGGPSSYLLGSNANGVSVGHADTPELWRPGQYVSRPFVYRNGQLQELETLGGPLGVAIAINGSGTIVGASQTALGDGRIGSEPMRPCIWTNGVVQDLGGFGGPQGSAYDINSHGWVVGSSNTADSLPRTFVYPEHAFLYAGDELIDLGTLGGVNSIAYSLNARGDVVGWSETGEYIPEVNAPIKHGTMWSDGFLYDLGTLGGAQSQANDINDRGQIVGSSLMQEPSGITLSHAVLWNQGEIIDLNPLTDDPSWWLHEAISIDNRGRILANALRGSEWRAVLLTPIGNR